MLLQKLLINGTKPSTLNLRARGFSSFNYLLNKDNDKIYYVATPIFYVNAVPHIGHLYTSVISDTIHRFQRDVLLKPSFLSTGTDEHGLKVQQAAQKQGIDPKLFCDGVSPSFKKLDKLFNVDYSTFIRTSDDNHKKTAQLIWKQLKELGYIYQDTYKGWYSIVDEAFYNDSEVEKIIDQVTGVEKMVNL
ncbi:hypothetical protein CONCODRAFT_9703 [Conidiobolus coronatus NRRL 28638]|uniref:Methionyl/Leucyl tRNA synthetase domain-containing protein n=1 Tax=Conidiobolus coronatus (strain ATCC 28846 / CBS 209.66 / NRRL 28638) TaxID=796925 RepID=A0A137NZB8_CONC2|nr:hypothetical protein CONCODRAFT_9703 [Conidiobolus coronatus NRRL 28638]|eukprot:KXN68107.1 hypothetical protein CONCODRAFT_9703 [Conidiobolus coronatus NRRL 28638]